jgi:nitrite reductase/ring-hydroxylating ferredoxin subunit
VRHRLFPSSELARGQSRSVVVERIRVLVVRDDDGSLYALRDRCAHRGALLSCGGLRREITAPDVGEYLMTERLLVECPWHGFEFDVKTGTCISDARYRAKSYRVEVDDGYIVFER